MSRTNNYKSDSLRMTNQTTVEEVQSFLRRRIRQPYLYQDTVVWNFNNHPINEPVLEQGIDGKLEHDKYLIPFSVTGSFGMMFCMLPETIQRAEVLVYKENFGEYSAYTSLIREAEQGGDRFQRQMEEELEKMNVV